MTLAVHTGAGTLPIVAHGTPEQQARLVPPLAAGHELAAFALTEAGAGSDAAALRTRARDGRITGTKQWVTNGSHAATILVFARAEAGITAHVVRAAPPGPAGRARGGEARPALLLHRRPVFEDTPGEVLGAPGKGMRVALSTLDAGRIGIAAQAVGIAQAALDLAAGYARERTAFGGPIARFQAIQHKLADMQTEIEAARALTWRAARLRDAGRPHSVEGAQAKLFASAVARRQTGEAIQVLGGYGYTTEFPAERYYRDAKVTEIYEGTSEIQRLVIARGAARRGHARLSPDTRRRRGHRPASRAKRPPVAARRARSSRAAPAMKRASPALTGSSSVPQCRHRQRLLRRGRQPCVAAAMRAMDVWHAWLLRPSPATKVRPVPSPGGR